MEPDHLPVPGTGAPTLRRNYLGGLENIAQTLGTMAPTGTLGVIIPLLIGKTGNGTWLLFLAVLGICLLILVNINGFASRCASAGGLATYSRLGLGTGAGVWTGWIYIGAMLFGAASSAPSAAYYACLVISRATGIPNGVPLEAAVTGLVALAAWWTAFRDMKLSGDVMIVIEVTSLAVMIAIIALAMAKNGVWVDRPQIVLQGAGPGAFSAGLVLAFLTMGGFESATTLGDEAKNAERAIPRAILGCVVPIGILYLVMTYLLVGLGRKFGIALDQLDTPFDTLSRLNGLPVLGTLSSVGVALSYFACTLGSINAGSRTMYSMSEDGYFPAAFGRAHPRNATPHRAIALFGVASIAVPVALLLKGVTLYSIIDYISQLAALGFIGAYFMVCLASPFFLAREGGLNKPRVAASVAALLLLGVVMVSERVSRAPGPRMLPSLRVFGGVVVAGAPCLVAGPVRNALPDPRMKAFVKGDIDGFIALWLDNLVVMIGLVKLSLGFPLSLDPPLFYSRLMPASAVGLLIGNLYYAWQAHRLARREKRTDVCALPFGMSIILLVTFVFLVLYPAKVRALNAGLSEAEASMAAWRAGVGAAFIMGLRGVLPAPSSQPRSGALRRGLRFSPP